MQAGGRAPSGRRSLVSAGTYALAAGAQRAVGFVLLPVYTVALTRGEYGRLSLLVAIGGAAAIVLPLGFEYAVVREYFQLEGDAEGQRRFILSAWTFSMCVAPAAALLLAVLVLLLVHSSAVFRPLEVSGVLVSTAVLVAATTVPLSVLRCEQRLKPYLVLSAVSAGVTAVVTVACVVVLDWGVSGWIAATLAANLATLAVAMRLLPWSPVGAFDRVRVRAALALGLPLVPHAAAHWSLQLADRALLAALVTPAALGTYGLGSNLALPTLVIVQSLNQGFLPSYARKRDAAAQSELRETILVHVGLVLAIGCAVALLGPPVVHIIAPASYALAASVVPWIALGYVFLGAYCVPMNGISLMLGRTKFIWPLTALAALVNLSLIALLVPTEGILAAAIASAVGYAVLLVAIALYAFKLRVPLEIDWLRLGLTTVVVGATYFVGVAVCPARGGLAIGARCLLIATLPVSIAVTSGLNLRRFRKRLRKP